MDELNELWAIQALIEEENEYLRTVLSWVSSREPKLGMLFSEFKWHDGFGVGKIIEHLNHHWVYGLVGECAEKSDTHASTSKPIPTKDGVYTEPPPKAPKKPIWVEKPNHLKNKLDTLPDIAHEHPKPQRMSRPTVWIPSGTTSDAKNSPPFQSKSQPASELEAFTFPVPQPKKPEPRVNPQPERVRFHCEHCGRDGHLAEFYYRRKRAERWERQWRNQDLYHPVHGVHRPRQFPPSSGAKREQHRHEGERREGARRDPRHGQYGFGGHGRSIGPPRFGGPRFPPRGDRTQRRSDFVDVTNPIVEQMARHWFSTHYPNPSVESFARSFPHF